ncbi:type VI secretion system baseplate subunit TssG [Methylomonas sp. SURF-2]|uniref:Type VI secretion system baseplate subunit TssG n=1 Tax=Methylomonas subterranea TaxID=2952225 RepID=A0ABT1TIN0_9GAMM|nr:type VI secretion system baseplate subunit TssG [Methylomonas sp. SURF-2]MCQ8105336.1 type VI secretion system baseplate subunit TssG [Methylomonas sp. SURF-2]
MADSNRTPTHVLIGELEQAAERFDFFETLRWLEAINADKPRLGAAVKLSDDAIRLSQEPELQFPASTLSSCRVPESGIPRLAVNFFGLFGPNGALPLHLTEYARERLRNHHDPTLARFADIFHHRMLCLFYRAWANARPTVSYDRPQTDRFAAYVGSLLGIGGETFRHRDALDDRAKLFYAAHFSAQTKSPDSLQAIIADILAIRVRIEEFVGEWMEIQISDHSRLGYAPELATLGQSTLLGAFVWGCQHKFRIVLGPLKLFQYLALLPGAPGLAKLAALVRNFVGDELVWDAQLILHKNEVPAELSLGVPARASDLCMNGEARLGWSMWLGPRPSPRDADDLTLNPFFAAG